MVTAIETKELSISYGETIIINELDLKFHKAKLPSLLEEMAAGNRHSFVPLPDFKAKIRGCFA